MGTWTGPMTTRWGRVAALALGLTSGACDGPTRPTPGASSSESFSDLLSITLDGRTPLAPGECVQFSVTGQYVNGSARDLTQASCLSWQTTIPTVIALSRPGMVTARAVGGAAITV